MEQAKGPPKRALKAGSDPPDAGSPPLPPLPPPPPASLGYSSDNTTPDPPLDPPYVGEPPAGKKIGVDDCSINVVAQTVAGHIMVFSFHRCFQFCNCNMKVLLEIAAIIQDFYKHI